MAVALVHHRDQLMSLLPAAVAVAAWLLQELELALMAQMAIGSWVVAAAAVEQGRGQPHRQLMELVEIREELAEEEAEGEAAESSARAIGVELVVEEGTALLSY